MTPAYWLGLVAVIAIPLLIRHVRYQASVAESERVSPGWLRSKQ
jgi:hypothetical protein